MLETIKAIGPVLGIVAAVVILGVVATALGKWVGRRRWQRRFVYAFGFKPEDTWTARSFQQPEVDAELKRLAQALDARIQVEDNLVRRYTSGDSSSMRTPLRDLESYKTNRSELLAAKSEFWTAHRAASLAHFDVKEKYSDYLK